MKTLLLIALSTAALAATPALAQDGGADPHAPGPYAGAGKHAFYSVEQRIADLQARIAAMGRSGWRAMAELRSIRGFEAQQRARHGGELRDWDREALNVRLDRLERLTG